MFTLVAAADVAAEFEPVLAIGVDNEAKVEEVAVALEVNACNVLEAIGGEPDILLFTMELIS